MSDLVIGPHSGSDASPGFAKRASKILGNAAAYQLLQEIAEAVDHQNARLGEIHAMCTRILEKLA